MKEEITSRTLNIGPDTHYQPLERYTCRWCHFQTDLKVDLCRHTEVVHAKTRLLSHRPPTAHQCKTCPFSSYSLTCLLGHRCEVGPKRLTCDQSPDQPKHTFQPDLGCIQCRSQWGTCPEKSFRCDQCPFRTKKRANLTLHIAARHLDPATIKWYKCDQCVFMTKWSSVLRRHTKLKHAKNQTDLFTYQCSNLQMYQCDQCRVSVSSKVELHAHTRCKHRQLGHFPKNIFQKYKCQFCHFRSHSRLCVIGHSCALWVRILTKWFKCDQCQYQTNIKTNMVEHQITRHTGVKDIAWFPCEQCPYKAKVKGQLRKHVLRIHRRAELKWYRCDQCTFKSYMRHKFNEHVVALHRPEQVEWFKCDQCPHKTKWKHCLKKHVILQHGTKESINWFQCDQCSFRGKQKIHLTTHKVAKHLNTDEVKWHHCGQCSFVTKWTSALKRHVKLKHAKEADIEWFKCDHCHYTMKLKSNLHQHILKKHVNRK